jgi:threonyl-tRNA synthetase
LHGCQKIHQSLLNNLIRSKLIDSDDRLSKKIRDAQVRKVPFQLVVGDKEIESNEISYREYGKQDSVNLSLDNFVKLLKERINEHK